MQKMISLIKSTSSRKSKYTDYNLLIYSHKEKKCDCRYILEELEFMGKPASIILTHDVCIYRCQIYIHFIHNTNIVHEDFENASQFISF